MGSESPPAGRFRPATRDDAGGGTFTRGAPGTCPCEGAYDDGVPVRDERAKHYVWMAFLEYDNEDYRKEEWLRDYRILEPAPAGVCDVQRGRPQRPRVF